MEPEEKLRRELLVFGTVDWVELWVFPSLVSEILEIEDAEAVRAKSLALIKEFLDEGLMEAGVVHWDEGRFEPWDLSPEKSFARIKERWTKLGGEPGMSDFCWFDLTPKGNELVREWEKKGELPLQIQQASQ